MTTGNGAAFSHRLDRVTGEVVLSLNGKEHRLKPTMEAAEEVERVLDQGLEMLRSRIVYGGAIFAPENTVIDPKMTLKTWEMGAILAAGLRASGATTLATQEFGKRLVFEAGRAAIRPALVEYIWACCDGGRLRADDLKNEGSSSGSQQEPPGEAEDLESLIEGASGASSG